MIAQADKPVRSNVGRPTKYRPIFIKRLEQYIQNCPDVVPSLVGFCLDVGITPQTLHTWKTFDRNNLDEKRYPRIREFLDMLDRLKAYQERCALNGGASNKWSPVIAKLVLAKHGYTDKVSVEHDLSDSAKQMIGWFDDRKRVESREVLILDGDTA